jgi:hypothetical protein
MKKVKATDTGKFVTVYVPGEGKSDAVLLEVVDEIAEVWYPHIQNESGGVGERVMVEVANIVALGPSVAVNVPLF